MAENNENDKKICKRSIRPLEERNKLFQRLANRSTIPNYADVSNEFRTSRGNRHYNGINPCRCEIRRLKRRRTHKVNAEQHPYGDGNAVRQTVANPDSRRKGE